MEFDDTQREQPRGPLRSFHTRVGLAALVAVVAAAVAAGIALAQSHPKAIGTGVVVIDTNLAYQQGQAAGTGTVMTSSGEILTNNHVIRGATEIKVVVPGTGRSYSAQVVGYDVADDVAVLQASGASGLKTASYGNSSGVSTGQSVTAVGNAGGTGSFTPASGTVTNVNRSITVSDDQGGSENLTGMIETNAAIQPGDSGGPLLNSSGQVIGMDTAASQSGDAAYQQSGGGDGFAIPINKALGIAKEILMGDASATVHVGGTAFLGVEVTADQYGGSGAAVTNVVSGSPAADAGLQPGDLITSLNGQAISSPDDLTSTVLAQKAGSSVSATYVDQNGSTQTADLTLGSGPPR